MEVPEKKCSCHVSYYPKPDHIVYCPMHKAAPKLLEACKRASNELQVVREMYGMVKDAPTGCERELEEAIAACVLL